MDELDSKSKQSAKECRKRKKLRYQTLEAIAQREEEAITVLYQELEQMKLIFDQLDCGTVTVADARLKVSRLRGKASVESAKSPKLPQPKQRLRRSTAKKQTLRDGTGARRRGANATTDLAPIQTRRSPTQRNVSQLAHPCIGGARAEDHSVDRSADNEFGSFQSIAPEMSAEQYQQHQSTQLPTRCSTGAAALDQLQQPQQIQLGSDGIDSLTDDCKAYLFADPPFEFYPETLYQCQHHPVYAPAQYQETHQPQYLPEHHPSDIYHSQFWYDEAAHFPQQQYQTAAAAPQQYSWCSVRSAASHNEVAELHQLQGNSVAETLSYINNQASIA